MSSKQAMREKRSNSVPNADTGSNAENATPETVSTEPGAAKGANKATTMLANHKGKLAVGAAAMLGLAVFYKWRENKLAKDDPDEYARLRRLKAAVGSDDPKAPRKD